MLALAHKSIAGIYGVYLSEIAELKHACLLFFSSALSVVNNLKTTLLSTSTHQEICGTVAAAYRFCLLLLVYLYISAKL
jgi:hypothetical protein